MRKLALLFTLILSIGFVAFNLNPLTPAPIDQQIIKYNDVPYDGKRLYIGPVELNKSKKELKFTISNTGRRDINLGGSTDDIVVNLDPSFNNTGDMAMIKSLVTKMMKKRKSIDAGEVLTGQVMSLEASRPVATKERKRPAATEVETIDMGNGTVVLETAEKESDAKRGKFLNADDCPDLMIKDIQLIKVNKLHIALEYTIKNQGTGTAKMHGTKNSPDDNMFLKAYLSPTPKFSRSAIAIGEVYVKKEMGNKEGTLDRSREFKGKMYMNIRGRSAKTPYLILTLDPYQTVRECNERNNRSYVKIIE